MAKTRRAANMTLLLQGFRTASPNCACNSRRLATKYLKIWGALRALLHFPSQSAISAPCGVYEYTHGCPSVTRKPGDGQAEPRSAKPFLIYAELAAMTFPAGGVRRFLKSKREREGGNRRPIRRRRSFFEPLEDRSMLAIAYVVPAGTLGNQNAGFSLGMAFDVNVPITVTEL